MNQFNKYSKNSKDLYYKFWNIKKNTQPIKTYTAGSIFKNPDDIKRFMEMSNDRRKIIDEAPATPLPKTYGVNQLSKALHPNVIPAKVVLPRPGGPYKRTWSSCSFLLLAASFTSLTLVYISITS